MEQNQTLLSQIQEFLPSSSDDDLLQKYIKINNEHSQIKKQLFEKNEQVCEKIRSTIKAPELLGKEYIYAKYNFIGDGNEEDSKLGQYSGLFIDTLNGKKISPYYSVLRIGDLKALNVLMSRFNKTQISGSFFSGENYLFALSLDTEMGDETDIDELGFPLHIYSGYIIKL